MSQRPWDCSKLLLRPSGRLLAAALTALREEDGLAGVVPGSNPYLSWLVCFLSGQTQVSIFIIPEKNAVRSPLWYD